MKTKSSILRIDFSKVKIAAAIMRSLAHPLRLEILKFIDGKKKTDVMSIYNTLQIDQSIASQHLKILRDQGIVLYERDGKQKFYELNYDRIKALNITLQEYFPINSN